MSRKCKICNNLTAASQVNAMIESRVKLTIIAQEVPEFSPYQLSRHKNNCLAPKPTGDLSIEQGSQEIARWLERAESTFLVAQANGDTKSAASAISTAVRTLQSLHKKREAEQEAAKKVADPSDVQVTVAQIDALIRHDAENGTANNGYPRVYTLFNEEQLFRQLVNAIWDNRALLSMLLAAAATNYIPERKSDNVQPNN